MIYKVEKSSHLVMKLK